MDDLSEKLSEILNNPDSMAQVRQMAESMLGTEKEAENENFADAETVGKIMQVVKRLKSGGDDDRTALLLALKPHLHQEKREKVDKAVKLLKIIEILPSLKESGFLDF